MLRPFLFAPAEATLLFFQQSPYVPSPMMTKAELRTKDKHCHHCNKLIMRQSSTCAPCNRERYKKQTHSILKNKVAYQPSFCN